jgi:hypothetical protein
MKTIKIITNKDYLKMGTAVLRSRAVDEKYNLDGVD